MLSGEWSLVSCRGQSDTGKEFFPYGSQPVGYLCYTASNKVIVILSNSNRSKFNSEDLSQTTIQEKATAFDEFDSYYGNYEINEEQKIVSHHILAGRVPNWINQNHPRYYNIEDDKLTLKTQYFQMNGENWQVVVEWLRISPK
jgi:hypothetical protein